MSVSRPGKSSSIAQTPAGSITSPQAQARIRRRQQVNRLFAFLTFTPVFLALSLLTVLFFDVLTDSVSWQIVEPRNSGQSFALSQAFGSRAVIRLELLAQGKTSEEIEAFFADAEALRKFKARNRVELMWYTADGPFRWIVSNSRDKRISDIGLFEGWGQRQELLASLKEGQSLYLNPWFDFSFFTKNASRTPIMAGLSSAFFGTLWVIGLVILISLPLGVGGALYLEEYAPDNRWTRLLEVNLRNLAGVPSIVYGILGLSVFVRLLNIGPTVLAAAATLSLLILPVIVMASREAIRAVPTSLRLASYGLGATKWQTVSKVVLPNAVSGIVTGVILAVARAIGETAPLLLVGAAAFVPYSPNSPLSKYTVLPIQIYSWVSENDAEFKHVASAGIIVLLIVLLVLYGFAFVIRRRFRRNW